MVTLAESGVPIVHPSGRHIPSVPSAGVHPGSEAVPATGVRALLLRRAPRTQRPAAQRTPVTSALQLH